MIVHNMQVGQGVIVFWALSDWSKREAIKEGLLDLGLQKFVPEPRTPPAALKDALGEVFTLPTQLIRPLSAKDGFTVVEENRGLDANGYVTVVTAKINKQLHVSLEPYSMEQSADIVTRFNKHMGLLTTANVGAALVKILDHFGGTKLRPSGSVYWLPAHRLSDWAEVAAVIERAAVGRPSALYRIAHPLDEHAVRAVRDAIVAEVSAASRNIEREVQSGELGEKALETRRDQAQELAKKVHLYEDLLGVGLQHLVDGAERLENAAAAAALTLSIAGGLVEQVA